MDTVIAILEEATAQARSVRALARQALGVARNAKAAIHRLPVEVLSMVFRMAADCGRMHSTPDQAPIFDINMPIPLTHVCTLWRNIVQGQPSFWSTIICRLRDDNPHSGEQALHYLALAANSPLDVYILITNENDGDRSLAQELFLDELALRSRQLRVLHIPDVSSTADEGVLSRFVVDAPLLEDFCITEDEANPFELPTLFNNCTPSLTHLTLGTCKLSPGNTFLNLRHLHLSDQVCEDIHDFDHIFSILRHNPLLVQLSMRNCRCYEWNFDALIASISRQSSAVPLLRRLVFKRCDAESVAALCTFIQLPTRGLTISVLRAHPLFCVNLSPTKRSVLRGTILGLPYTCLDISFPDSTLFAATADQAVALHVRCGHCVWSSARLPQVERLFTFAALHTLRLRVCKSGCSEAWDRDLWQHFLSSCVSLKTLELDTTCTRHFTAWTLLLSADELDGRAYPGPTLQTLCIAIPPNADNVNLLVPVVRSRRRSGHPLRVLHVVCAAFDFGATEERQDCGSGLASETSEQRELAELVGELKVFREHSCIRLHRELQNRFRDDFL